MLQPIRQIFWWLLLLGILTIFIFLGLGSLPSQTVIATVNQLEEASGEILYHS